MMPGKKQAARSAQKNEALEKKVLLGNEIKSRVIYASVGWRKSFPSLIPSTAVSCMHLARC